MSRLIDADALLERIKTYCDGCNSYGGVMCRACGYGDAIDAIEDAPTIDAVPVVHGRWVDKMCRDWRCSECGEKINKVRNVDGYCYDDKPNYCPNCGARMDGDE